MSRKNNSKKMPQKAQAEKDEKIKKAKEKSTASFGKKKTAIIISASAVFLAACVLVGVFVVKPAIENKKETTTAVQGESSGGNKTEGYTYVEYKGTKMPKEFADILNQAAIDGANACDKRGVALTLGEREISLTEFNLYYIDRYYSQVSSVNYSIEQTGANRTGYDVSVLPDEQKYMTTSMTWAEKFSMDAADEIAQDYAGFDLAIENKVEFTEEEIESIIKNYERVIDRAELKKQEPNEALEAVYTEGITYEMFAAREIMESYASKYESGKKLELYESYSTEKVEQELEDNLSDYQVIKGRVYPIEGDYDAVEASKIKNDAEFIEYANNNNPQSGYDAETTTQCYYVTKDTIASVFDEKVAEWMFSPDRVQGEITVIRGELYYYLAEVIELPYLSTSCHIMSYETSYDIQTSEEMGETQLNKAKALLEEWKNGEATPESFAKIAQNSLNDPETDVRIGAYSHYEITNWLFDKRRKSGDCELFTDDSTIYIIYYIEKNEDDYDWDIYIRNTFANEDYENLFNEAIESDKYEIEFKTKVLSSAIKSANVKINKKINESKES